MSPTHTHEPPPIRITLTHPNTRPKLNAHPMKAMRRPPPPGPVAIAPVPGGGSGLPHGVRRPGSSARQSHPCLQSPCLARLPGLIWPLSSQHLPPGLRCGWRAGGLSPPVPPSAAPARHASLRPGTCHRGRSRRHRRPPQGRPCLMPPAPPSRPPNPPRLTPPPQIRRSGLLAPHKATGGGSIGGAGGMSASLPCRQGRPRGFPSLARSVRGATRPPRHPPPHPP